MIIMDIWCACMLGKQGMFKFGALFSLLGLNQSVQKPMTVCEHFVDIPYLAAFKHARVHDVGAHESRLHSFNLLSQ